MTGPFLPEFNSIPVRGGYRGSYRLFEGQPFRFIPGCEPYMTAGQALEAAKTYVRDRINSKLESERIEVEAELSEFDIWKRRQTEQEQAERDRVFGKGPRAIVRNCAGGEVKVERRKVRA